MSTNTKLAEALRRLIGASMVAMTDQELATGETLSAWEDANEALAAHDAEQAAIPADAGEERMAFEAALFDLYEFAPDRPSFGRYQDGDYRDTRTHKFWRVWQARAALAQRQPLTDEQTEDAYGWTDADADAARLALELECILLDPDTPMPLASRWWGSAHEALALHRQRLASEQSHGIGTTTGEQR